MSGTPRTDAAEFEVKLTNGTSLGMHVRSEMARELERELNAARLSDYCVECYTTEPPRPAMLHHVKDVARGDYSNGIRIHTHEEFTKLQVELERAKEDRNRSGVEERRKYLPKLQELKAKLDAANAGLRRIIDGIPACDPHGGMFVPHFDGDGNEIGIEPVDPLAVIQCVVGVATDTLKQTE